MLLRWVISACEVVLESFLITGNVLVCNLRVFVTFEFEQVRVSSLPRVIWWYWLEDLLFLLLALVSLTGVTFLDQVDNGPWSED